MKKIIITITAASLLSGCIFSGDSSKLLTGADGRVIAGRNQYDGYADGKESDSKALKAMAEAIGEDTVTVENKIDENGNPVTTTTISLGGLILASKMDQVQSVMAQTSVPKTALAQGIEATGSAVKDVLTTPAAVGGIVGLTAVEMAKGIGDQNGDNYDIKVIGDGTATGPVTSGDTIMQPAPLGVE